MKIINIFKIIGIYFCLVSRIIAFDDLKPIGDLDITVRIEPYGTTKSYNFSNDGNYVLDAGIFNGNDEFSDFKVAEVYVLMEAKKNGEYQESTHNACAIDGEFNGMLSLARLEGAVNGKEIKLNTLVKYNNAENVIMKLKTDNYRMTHKHIVDEVRRDGDSQEYMFSAYPEKSNGCVLDNKILVFGYKFDLILDVKNFNPGDIVRGDVSLDNSTVRATTDKGTLQDIIRDQILSIMQRQN